MFRRFNQLIIMRSRHLLAMDYSVADLADTLGVNDRIVRDWVQSDLPHTRDATGHLLIFGPSFASWVEENRAQRNTRKFQLSSGQGMCLRCKSVVVIADPMKIQTGAGRMLRGYCPNCQAQVCRGTK